METIAHYQRELSRVAYKSHCAEEVDEAGSNAVKQIAHIIKHRGMVTIGNMTFTSDVHAVEALYHGGHGEYPNRERLLEIDAQFWRAADTDPQYVLSHDNIRDAIDEAGSCLQHEEDIRVPELHGEIFTNVHDVTLRLYLGKPGAELLLKHLLTLRDHSSDSNASHFRRSG